MESSKRTKEETIKYFKQLSHEYAVLVRRTGSKECETKAECYELAAFQLERNME